MIEIVSYLLPRAVLISHIVFALLFVITIFRVEKSMSLVRWVGKNALILSFLISLSAVLGSLFYSEVLGFEPCILCWWQRVFIYPLVVIFGTAILKKFDSAFSYAVPLAVLATLISVYQSYVYLGGSSLFPCTAVGGACSKVYVMEFGYITIPLMSMTVSLYILLAAWMNKIYRNENSNT